MRAFLLSALLASAFQTALGAVEGQWTYIIENGAATITASTATGAVTIPSVLGGYAVKKLGNGLPPIFGNPNTSVTSVTIPYGVTSIGSYAFAYCTNLTSINFPSTVTSIGDYAFRDCRTLASVSIPTSLAAAGAEVTRFGVGVFQACYSLASVFLPPTITASQISGRFLGSDATFYAGTAGTPTAMATQAQLATTQTELATTQAQLATTQAELGTFATKTELTSSLTQSRTDGVNSVLSNPNLWTLYTTSQIQNMAVGDLVLNRQSGGGFVLNYDIEQSTDLQNWTRYEALSLPLNGLPTDKAFVRIKAKQ